ncbi:MAG: hypothetical protein EB120_03090, partial [Proteobacteria bacterium]|nr:hypothetical protein [Pseudomonadota bacterium]
MKHLIFSLLLLFFFVEVFSVLPARITRTPEISKSQYVSGLINVHSHYSDGYLAIPELAAIAREAGHQFIVFGDKTTAEARKQNFDRDLGGIDSFVELEATTQSGQLLIFFSHSSASSFSDKEISRLGYERFLGKNAETPIFVSVSHPSHVKQPWTQLERFSDGLEVVNFDSLFWRQLSDAPLGFMGMSLLYPLNQFASALRFIQPYPKDFQTWDNMNTLDMGHFGLLSSQFKPKFQSPLNNISWPSYR